MSFTNLYYKRTTGTPRSCFICYKPSTTCLTTQNTVDFLYTCDAHLRDPGFATRIPEEPEKPGLNAAEIAEIKAEWEERKKRKEDQDKAKKEEGKDKDGDKKDESKDSKEESKEKAKPSTSTPTPSTPSEAPKPKHERYTLHRDIFSLRQSEHRKKRQTAEAKKLAPQLPAAPRSSVA